MPAVAGRGAGVARGGTPGHAYRAVAIALALLVVALAGATLFEHLSGVDLGIDQTFAVDTASASSPHPGRFAAQTSIVFLSAALALVAMGRTVHRVYPSEVLGVICAGIGGVGVLGYMFGADALLSLGSATQVSFPASCALTLLCAGLIVANPGHRLVRLLDDSGTAGQVMRVFLPAALLVVPAAAWLRLYGEHAGLYDEGVGRAVMVAFEAIILGAIGVWMTSRVQRFEAEGLGARRDRDRFFELTTDLVCRRRAGSTGAGQPELATGTWIADARDRFAARDGVPAPR
jgi:hypothetical protein